jgi:hypothetical protein
MPLIAFTSGCDPAECFLLNTVGISASEFVPPTAPLPVAYPNNTNPAAGHVHFFTAYNNTAGGGGPGGPGGAASASAVTGGNTPTDTYAWWQSAANLQQYDIIFNACECNPNARGATANAAMDAYLINGGRLFATHYYYNWFTPSPPATADLASVVDWTIPQNATIVNSEADAIDTTFPIGMAFATWLQDNGVTTTLGAITLADTRNDMGGLTPAGCSEVAGTCLATQWIYDPVNNDPRYISFNTPVGPPSNAQCGKAVFSDVHLSGTSNDQVFPAECSNPGIDSPPGHAVNEKALLFLFFDLSACVQNESSPPTIPPPAAGTQPK